MIFHYKVRENQGCKGQVKKPDKKVTLEDMQFMEGLEKTLSEWSEKNDEEAYKNLKDT